MSATAADGARISFDELLMISGCLALSLIADVAELPVWVTVTVAVSVAIRLARAAQGADAPPRAIRLIVSAVSIGLLFLQLRTFNGLSAGGTLLCLVAGLKILETRTRRDLRVVAMIVYFLSLAMLLQSESFWLFAYLVGVTWLTTSVQLRPTVSPSAGDRRRNLRLAGRLMAQAMPIAIVFWLFFPRLGGPLWQLPDDGRGATSGLGDSMSPGDITDLAMSDEVAFRVRFTAQTPPAEDRYWRGPVLHDFDGRAWTRPEAWRTVYPPLRFHGTAYEYVVSLEPDRHHWIFALDWPSQWNASQAYLTTDYMLMQRSSTMEPVDVIVTSRPLIEPKDPLTPGMRRIDTALPSGRNPRSMRLAQTIHAAHPDALDFVHAVLDMFRHEEFFYTLKPPRLAGDTVDEFLFDSRRGFCGHYASAFAALMRAAGIPARVVTGYHGGTFNRFAGYWIIRQSDAHAWDEVWIEGHGWLRVDPTSMIAPERVERGLNDIVSAGQSVTSRWQQRTPWLGDIRLRLDALRLLWRDRILRFDETSQVRLLELLHIPEPDGRKLVLVLAACLTAGMGWLTWQIRRDLTLRPRDRVERAYATLCRRLAAIGLERAPAEAAEAYAARVASHRPDLAAVVVDLCRRYSDLRYARPPALRTAAAFIVRVRSFRPRGSRASS